MKTKRTALFGIITCLIYFGSVLFFLITKLEMALTIWEGMTVFGAVAIVFVLIHLADILQIAAFYRNLLQIFLACTCSLTGLAHTVNVLVTRRLMAEGVEVPAYFQIGYWPSVEMAVDYLAWGFFMGTAFLMLGVAVPDTDCSNKNIKRNILVCGILCLTGFFGAAFVHENLWYLAPLGYGCGTIVLCCQMMKG